MDSNVVHHRVTAMPIMQLEACTAGLLQW